MLAPRAVLEKPLQVSAAHGRGACGWGDGWSHNGHGTGCTYGGGGGSFSNRSFLLRTKRNSIGNLLQVAVAPSHLGTEICCKGRNKDDWLELSGLQASRSAWRRAAPERNRQSGPPYSCRRDVLTAQRRCRLHCLALPAPLQPCFKHVVLETLDYLGEIKAEMVFAHTKGALWLDR